MQRVRMSLPYFKDFGWEASVVTIDSKHAEIAHDNLLVQSVPDYIKIYYVNALSKKWTSKLGLGSIALRSLRDYRRVVNSILQTNKYDLIYFSTTQFPVCILGAYWKKRFGIPYVIDMQDPWHSEYYKGKPKTQRPPKYWFSYRLNKYMEPIAMKHVGGVISVSDAYITDLKSRYPEMRHVPAATITFGAFEPDIKIAVNNRDKFNSLLQPAFKNIVYVGRGGMDMHKAIIPVFEALKKGIEDQPEIFAKLKLHFFGTSYAPTGKGIQTILPLAKQYGIEKNVIEFPDRISYYHTLLTLQQADALFIPGSDDPKYTASKIYPYLLTTKPLLAIFNEQSPAMGVLHEYGVTHAYGFNHIAPPVNIFLQQVSNGEAVADNYNPAAIEKYAAKNLTGSQCQLFNAVLEQL